MCFRWGWRLPLALPLSQFFFFMFAMVSGLFQFHLGCSLPLLLESTICSLSAASTENPQHYPLREIIEQMQNLRVICYRFQYVIVVLDIVSIYNIKVITFFIVPIYRYQTEIFFISLHIYSYFVFIFSVHVAIRFSSSSSLVFFISSSLYPCLRFDLPLASSPLPTCDLHLIASKHI
jgi:hypothetical protein